MALDEQALAAGLGPEARKERGAFFTPRALVDRVLALAGELVPAEGPLAVVDPAAGAGAFLVAARDRFPRAQLLGAELEEKSAGLCWLRVPQAQVVVGDALSSEALDRLLKRVPRGAFELWVGNPPYNGTSPLLREKDAWARACSWMPPGLELPRGRSLREDFVFFLLKASARLEGRRGALAFITSATLLDAFLYSSVREALLARLSLRAVVDLGAGAFEGTAVRTCITVWESPRGRAEPARYEAQGVSRSFVPRAPAYRLRASSDEAEALDAAWRARGEPLTALVPVSFPGLKTRFDELLVDDDAERLFARVSAFLAAPAGALEGFAAEHGLPARLVPKLRALKAHAGEVEADRGCVRPFLRYRGPLAMGPAGHCYLHRRLIPRGDHRLQGDYDPHAEPVKLVFNVHEVPLAAHVVEAPGCVTAYRHSRFAPLRVPRQVLAEGPRAAARGAAGPMVPNLSPRGLELAERLGGPLEVYRAIARFLMSPPLQETWAPEFGTSRVAPVPLQDIVPGSTGTRE